VGLSQLVRRVLRVTVWAEMGRATRVTRKVRVIRKFMEGNLELGMSLV
jgi:hypothetical protein